EKNDAARLNYLVVGPWNHGGWARSKGDRLGPIPFGSDTAQHFRTEIEAPWFAYWLKDKGARDFAEATVFQTGSNRWEKYESWPPPPAQKKNLSLGDRGNLPGAAPADDGDPFDSYVSAPAHPVPSPPRRSARPIPPEAGRHGWWKTSALSITGPTC